MNGQTRTRAHRLFEAVGLIVASAVLTGAVLAGGGSAPGWLSVLGVLASLVLFGAGAAMALGDRQPLVFVVMLGIAPILFLVAIILHNLIYGLVGEEEAIFFTLALFGAPLLFATGLAGSAWLVGREVWRHRHDGDIPITGTS